jgi:hypothetical protein
MKPALPLAIGPEQPCITLDDLISKQPERV